MSVTGVCYICSSPANHTCESCGGVVCDEHYEAASGFCVRCARGRSFE
ncbi:MAG: hypothetical protein ACLFSW_01025 [Halobacteriales archaeon]